MEFYYLLNCLWIVCSAGMARTVEFVLHFVGCDMVTVLPNQNIIFIII